MKTIDPKKTIVELSQFLTDEFGKAGFEHAVLGLSGGVDSATSCGLAVQALGVAKVHVVLMPFGKLNDKGIEDALLVARTLGLPRENIHIVDISQLAQSFFMLDPTMDDLRKGNIMARVRMITLYDWARRLGALVVGTENKSEHFLGYYTRFGDEASDIEPLRNLYKAHVYQVAKELGVPAEVLTKAPTAGLWEGQTDEGEFGFTYEDADKVLSGFYDEGKSVDGLVREGLERGVVERVLAHAKKNAFKHALPVVPPIGE